jgi:uncharacterized membrane protein YgcG
MKKIFLFLASAMLILSSCSSTKSIVRSQSYYTDDVYTQNKEIVQDTTTPKDTTMYYDESLGYGTSYDSKTTFYVNILDPSPYYVSIYSPYYYGYYNWGWYNPYFYYTPYYYYCWGWYNPYSYYGYGWGYPYYGHYHHDYWHHGHGWHNGHDGWHNGHNGYYYGKRNPALYNSNTNSLYRNSRSVQQRVNSRVANTRTQVQPKYQRSVQSYSYPAYREAKSSREYINNNRYYTPPRSTAPTNRGYNSPSQQNTRQSSSPSPQNYRSPSNNGNYNGGAQRTNTSRGNRVNSSTPMRSPVPSSSPGRSAGGFGGGGGMRSGGGGGGSHGGGGGRR